MMLNKTLIQWFSVNVTAKALFVSKHWDFLSRFRIYFINERSDLKFPIFPDEKNLNEVLHEIF